VANGTTAAEAERHQRLYDDLRLKLLDLSRRNPMLNYKHRAGSRRQLRIVDANLEKVFEALVINQKELVVQPLPEPDDIPDDERTETFLSALANAKASDFDYLTRLTALEGVARQDESSLAQLDRWLRDRVREQLELPPRPPRDKLDVFAHARKHGINPSYDLSKDGAAARPTRLQSMHFADELDTRLARIASDARLAEQETGLSTLFLAFGFLRWFESPTSEVTNFAPLLLLQVELRKRMEGRRAIYLIKAAAEQPDINLSLRELLLRSSPDSSRELPEFDEDDTIEKYFTKVGDTIEGLPQWRIERNLTLGHFTFGRLAMYEDLSPENWQTPPTNHSLLQGLLHGSQLDGIESSFFASDYDLDDEKIENVAPILINDADASQHSAIVDVMQGKNLAIEGPPGTGKSQTITNIIANALYAGKTVLFLADKLAALQVVKDRLDAAGLGEFCFELHSDKTHPRSVIENLQQRHRMNQEIGAASSWESDLERLRNSRVPVGKYLSALHKPQDDDGFTSFQLFWAAIAARRNLPREFEAVRRCDLNSVLSRTRPELEQLCDNLRLYAVTVSTFANRHGDHSESPWTKANFQVPQEQDPLVVGDIVRDAYESAKGLASYLSEKTLQLGIELPNRPTEITEWVANVERIPTVPECSLLSKLSSFKSGEINSATQLAEERLELGRAEQVGFPKTDPQKLLDLAKVVAENELSTLSPSALIARLDSMQSVKTDLLDGLKFFASVVSAFKPSGIPTVSMAEGIAATVKFAASIPPKLDEILSFDREESQAFLTDGHERLTSIFALERTLRTKFILPSDQRWPTVDSLKNLVETADATGLRKIITVITGRRRRATEVSSLLGTSLNDPNVRANVRELIKHLESSARFLNDATLSATASPYWSGFQTPLGNLVSVLRARQNFERQIVGLGELHKTVKSHLFSNNRKFIQTLRSYNSRAQTFLAAAGAWPASISQTPLAQAQRVVDDSIERLKPLAEHINQIGLTNVSIPFAQLAFDAKRRLRIAELETQIASDPVLRSVDEHVWLTEPGCRVLRQTAELSDQVKTIVPAGPVRDKLFSPDAGNFSRLLRATSAGLDPLNRSYQEDARRLAASLGGNLVSDNEEPTTIVSLIEPCLQSIQSFSEWCEVKKRRISLHSEGLGPLLDAFAEAKIPVDRLADTFNGLGFYHRAVRARQNLTPLKDANGLDLEDHRRRFVAADKSLKEHQRTSLRIKLLQNEIPRGSDVGNKRDWTEFHFLRNEFTKQARHAPIRRLLTRADRAIRAMKPCFMMSPLSLAKYLPSTAMTFDLLVIDEASQMKPEDALGGLLRAKQAIVVGDPNQLPPTDFFARVAPVDNAPAVAEDEEPDDIDAESILDWSLKTYPAPRRLKWHYRSKCESLIAFSNKEFYSSGPGSSGDLITFPNPVPGSFSIDLIRVNGNYKASRNPTEVARIVEAAIDFMLRHADLPPDQIPTLGIAAINIEQKEAIREEFNRSARDEAIERYLAACNTGSSKHGPEPFFIKNLENVQGDERDVIMISLTYGREPGQTRVMQRFGPITRSQGHRRLNVLFTRARSRVVIFSSMGSDDILVTQTSRRGVRVLRDYLRYAESRRLEVGQPTGYDFDSDFERDVKSRLDGHGFTVDPQVGVAGYRIDLGVRHPKNQAVYMAGVECDGASFHNTKSARDRDRLRESVLRGLGWEILRVWSTDWFLDANLQTERLVAKLKALSERPVTPVTKWVVGVPAFAPSVPKGHVREDVPQDSINAKIVSQTSPTTAFEDSTDISPRNNEIVIREDRVDEGTLSDDQVRAALVRYRDDVIFNQFPGSEPERCILRDLMIDKIVEQRLDEPSDFVRKIPLWLRERTDHRQAKFLPDVCAIVERLNSSKS
jgi:very-short-patch-repair endonuclease